MKNPTPHTIGTPINKTVSIVLRDDNSEVGVVEGNGPFLVLPVPLVLLLLLEVVVVPVRTRVVVGACCGLIILPGPVNVVAAGNERRQS